MPINTPPFYLQPDAEIDNLDSVATVDPKTGLPDIDRLGNARMADASLKGMPLPNCEDIDSAHLAGIDEDPFFFSLPDIDDIMTDERMLELILTERDTLKQADMICQSIGSCHGEAVIKHFASIPLEILAIEQPCFFDQRWIMNAINFSGIDEIAELMKIPHIPSMLTSENDTALCLDLFERAILANHKTLARQLLAIPALHHGVRSGQYSPIILALEIGQRELAHALTNIAWPRICDTPEEILMHIGLDSYSSPRSAEQTERVESMRGFGFFSTNHHSSSAEEQTPEFSAHLTF